MRKMFAALALIMAAALFLTPASAGTTAPDKNALPPLTTDLALQLAYKNNPSLSAAQARIEQAKQQIKQAQADKLPQLYATLAGQWQDKEGVLPVYAPQLAHSTSAIGYATHSFDEVYNAALGFQWLLFSSGAVENLVAARKLTYRGIRAKEIRTGQTVENSVRVCYYDLQRARAKLTVAEEVLALSKEHLSQVEYFYKYGVVAQDEVLRVQVDVSNGELNVISARNAVDVRWRALERAVGVNLRDRYSMPQPEMKSAARPVPIWDDSSLYSWRPELQALNYSREAADAAASAAKGNNGPKIVVAGEGFNQGLEFWPDDLDTWKISVGLRWDFYDGGKSHAQVKEYRARAQELLSQIEDLKKQISLEVSSAQLNYESARQRIDVAARQVASAQEDYRMALMRYKANVGTNLDVLDARTALTNARTQLVDAVYDTDSSRANLDYALGLSDKYMLDSAAPPKNAPESSAASQTAKTQEKSGTQKQNVSRK
jgi:outer membrane protein